VSTSPPTPWTIQRPARRNLRSGVSLCQRVNYVRNWRWFAPGAQRAAQLHGGEAWVTISMSRAERADLGQRGARPGAARRRTHGDERAAVPADTAEGGQVARLAHLLRFNPPDGRSSHIEWQPEGHRRL